MLNRSQSLAISTSVLKALPGNLISKDTHLVFSIYELGDSGQRLHADWEVTGLLTWVRVSVFIIKFEIPAKFFIKSSIINSW